MVNRAFCPASSSVYLDRILTRNPQRFIPPAVIAHLRQTSQMIIYRENLKSSKRKSELDSLLAERLITEEDRNKLYIFPFFLFSNSFWTDFKRTSRILFDGEFNGHGFKLETESIIFTRRRNLPLVITGSTEENKISLTYSIPIFAILIMVGFSLTVYFLGRIKADFEIISMFIGMLFILMYIVKVLRIHCVFKRICK